MLSYPYVTAAGTTREPAASRKTRYSSGRGRDRAARTSALRRTNDQWQRTAAMEHAAAPVAVAESYFKRIGGFEALPRYDIQ